MDNKRYLKKFNSQSDYESQKESVMGMPHVVLLDDTKEVVFASENNEDEIDYALEFFTIEALEEGEVSFTFGTGDVCADTLSYSLDNGQTWSELQRESATPTLQKGDKIQFKTVFNKENSSVCKFQTTMPFNVEGNIMSLLYGNDFKGKNELTNTCFGFCFANSSIVSAKNLILPATTLAKYCYSGMFDGCTSLTEAPELPATTLANYCYYYMFNGCTSLTTAPELPATTLANWCYSSMFNGCTSLTTAPELPATTLASYCYYGMFNQCSKLNYIKMLATDISATNCLNNWVNGVASSGTFVKNSNMTTLPSGTSGIPNGWRVVNTFNNISPCIINQASESITFVYSDGLFTPTNEIIDLSQHFTKEELLSVQPECEITVTLLDKTDNVLASDYVWVNDKTLGDVLNELGVTKDVYDINVIITKVNAPEDNGYYYYYDIENSFPISFSNNIQCSINGSDWKWLNGNTLTDEETEPFVDGNYFTIETDDGDIYKFKGNLTPIEYQGIGTFTIYKKCNVKGNIMSLLYGDDFEGQIDLSGKDYAFYELFQNCTTLKNAKNLILPATTLAYSCYSYMFNGCTSLTTAPELPATTLANYCYSFMFNGCTSLITAPELPATTLANSCYTSMFHGCTSLTKAPELPATTLANECYSNMFRDCTSLTEAPELPATKLAKYCYYSMFNQCSKLNYIKMLATNISASSCLYNWVNGVASSGTFVKNTAMTSLPSGTSGIPNGWTVEDYSV